MDKINKKQTRLQEIEELFDRLHKRLTRTVNAMDKLRKERKRLLAPRKLEAHEELKVTSKEYTKIREQDFGDEIPDFLKRV